MSFFSLKFWATFRNFSKMRGRKFRNFVWWISFWRWKTSQNFSEIRNFRISQELSLRRANEKVVFYSVSEDFSSWNRKIKSWDSFRVQAPGNQSFLNQSLCIFLYFNFTISPLIFIGMTPCQIYAFKNMHFNPFDDLNHSREITFEDKHRILTNY